MSRRPPGDHNKGTPARPGAPQPDVDWVIGAYGRWKTATRTGGAVEQAEALLELDDLMAHLAAHSTIYGPLAVTAGQRVRCANQGAE